MISNTHIKISSEPISKGGVLNLSNSGKDVRIQQIQLEQACYLLQAVQTLTWIQDTAKSTFHPRSESTSIDLNRAGSALIEIVSHPDMR